MKAHRILVHAAGDEQIGDLIRVGWGLARWHDAQIDACVSGRDGLATLGNRISGARANDVLIASVPDDPGMGVRLVRMLLHHGQRAILLPRRIRAGWTFAEWIPARHAGPGISSEAAVLAVIIQPHLRQAAGGVPVTPMDLIPTQAIAGVFNGIRPAWSGDPTTPPGRMRTISADSVDLEGTLSADHGDAGWIIIPARRPCRLGDAWDAGEVVVWRRSGPPPPGPGAAACFPQAIQAFVHGAGHAWTIAGAERIRSADLMVRIHGASLIDPGLHQTWETIHERLAMPALRADLLAAGDDAGVRSVLLLEDRSLDPTGSRVQDP